MDDNWRFSWPAERVPVEVFALIVGHLTFDEAKSLRVVNSEFSRKVAEAVIPSASVKFSPAMVRPGTTAHSTAQNIGHHVRSLTFASSVSHHDLRDASSDPCQRIEKAFWGLYRWPSNSMPGHSHLAEMQALGNEVGLMRRLLSRFPLLVSLTVSLDSGLGSLTGPPSRFPSWYVRPNRPVADFHPGWPPAEHRAEMIEAEGPPGSQSAIFHSDEDWWFPRGSGDGPKHGFDERRILRTLFADSGFLTDADIEKGMAILDLCEGKRVTDRDLNVCPRGRSDRIRNRRAPLTELLWQGQLKLLHNAESAHHGLLFSVAEAMTCCPGFSTRLHNLRISKISSSLLPLLFKTSFWAGLDSLHTLHVGVIPNWRSISLVGGEGAVMYQSVAENPADAVGAAFTLLNEFVGKFSPARVLLFEWICGGELASSPHRLNNSIHPAPFRGTAPGIMEEGGETFLSLPRVRKLILRNMWCTPRAFFDTMRKLNRQSLRSLELESVSLSGPAPQLPPPYLPEDGHAFDLETAVDMVRANLPGAAPFCVPNLPLSSEQRQNLVPSRLFQDERCSPEWFQASEPRLRADGTDRPDQHSWTAFIRTMVPGSVADPSAGADPSAVAGADGADASRACAGLDELTFRSCGYAYVQHPQVGNFVRLPRQAYANLRTMLLIRNPSLRKLQRENRAAAWYQEPARDELLAEIIMFLDPVEARTLQNDWGLAESWYGVYPGDFIEYYNALRNYQWPPAGAGRFSGYVTSSRRRKIPSRPSPPTP